MVNRGLYIHIPFCQDICSYCDFCKVKYNVKDASRYLENLEKELTSLNIKGVTSIYIGGGTPTSLDNELLERLLKMVSPYFHEGMSFTIEANFDSLNKEKIDLLAKYRINRISLGIQTFNKRLEKIINRNNDINLINDTIESLIKVGINNINVDLMYGLPTETLEEVSEDLDQFLKLKIKHISTYALSINEHTDFYNKHYKEADDELVRRMYDLIVTRLKEKGFNRYEVSNFALSGYESKHNLIYWRNEEYYGVGVGASGYINNIRYDNSKSLTKYLHGEVTRKEEIINDKDYDFYKVMLGLRLSEGVKIPSRYLEKIKKVEEEGLVEKVKDKYKVKDEYLFILDYVLNKILF